MAKKIEETLRSLAEEIDRFRVQIEKNQPLMLKYIEMMLKKKRETKDLLMKFVEDMVLENSTTKRAI